MNLNLKRSIVVYSALLFILPAASAFHVSEDWKLHEVSEKSSYRMGLGFQFAGFIESAKEESPTIQYRKVPLPSSIPEYLRGWAKQLWPKAEYRIATLAQHRLGDGAHLLEIQIHEGFQVERALLAGYPNGKELILLHYTDTISTYQKNRDRIKSALSKFSK